MKKLLIVLILILAFMQNAPVAADDIPVCRFDNTMKPAVAKAAQVALKSYSSLGTPLPFTKVVIAPGKPGKRDLLIELVQDANEKSVDGKGCRKSSNKKLGQWVIKPDSKTVDGVCFVADANRIRCSADALFRLAKREIEGNTPSTALLYVIAHEMGHLLHGDQASFNTAGRTLARSSGLAAKFAAWDASCDYDNPTAQKIEKRADEDAGRVLVHSLINYGYKESLLSPRASLMSHVFRLRLSASDLEKWPTSSEGNAGIILDLIETVPLPPTPDDIETFSKKIMCESLVVVKGNVRLPIFRGTHPDTVSRLKVLADSLEKRASTLTAEAPSGAMQPLPPGFDDLASTASSALIALDKEYAAMYPVLIKSVCTKRNKWRNQGVTQQQIATNCK